MLDLEWHGEALRLLSERALYWPRRRWLLVADLHVGKSGVFRRHGVPIPDGVDDDDLERLSGLVESLDPERIVILGDLVHRPFDADDDLLLPLVRFRESTDAPIVLVRGNHDGRLSLESIGIEDGGFRLDADPFVLVHDADADRSGTPAIGGHLHPGVTLRGPAGDRLRCPSFVERAEAFILPAFSRFSGLSIVDGERCHAVTPAGVITVPRVQARR